MICRKFLIVLSLILFFPFSGYGQIREVRPNVVYATEIELTKMYTDYLSYSVTVPEDAQGMRISIFNSPADLDIFVQHGEEIEDYESVAVYGISEQYNETIFFTRFSDPPLTTGKYFFDIAYQRKNFPTDGDEVLRTLPFSFKVEIITAEVEKELFPGRGYAAMLYPDKGMFTTFTLDVPPDAEVLRLDIDSPEADLDLLVQYGDFVESYDTADYTAESLLSRETLIVTKHSSRPLREGTYFITVLDQVAAEYPIGFTIYPQFSDVPPKELTAFPDLPRPRSSLERVLFSTVEIIADSGKGSGCIISPGGLIVTNFHVIKAYTGGAEEELSVALTIDTKLPPVELFRAEVLQTDMETDLALLRITSGLYGQPLPEGYQFPYVLLNTDSDYQIGDPVSCAGYPGIGGTGSRASVTFTRGVVSGFEKTSYGTLLKTDGLINSGSSGGAAVDRNYRLIGLPAIIMEEAAGQLGFILPVTLFPNEWIEMISGDK